MARSSLKSVMKLIDNVQRDRPDEEIFLDELKRSIEMSDQKNKRMPSKTYKPSSMACIRSMYYQTIGAETENDSTYCLVGICNSGTDIHARIQTAIEDMINNGFDCEYVDVAQFVTTRNLDYLNIVSKQGNETKLYHKDYNMSFLCDGIIRFHGKYYIVELKTETEKKWYYRDSVDPKHYAQGTAYSLAFGLDDVIFVYISRDTLDMKSFKFHVTESMRADMVTKILNCNAYVESGQCPPKPTDISPKSCTYCAYKSRCNNE